MFAAVTDVFLSAVGHYVNKNKPAENKLDGNYIIRGHINNFPVDINVEKGARSSTSSRPPLNTSQPCNNCGTNNFTSITNVSKKPSDISYKKQYGKDNNKFCKVVIPQEGNYEVKIRKFESNSMKLSASGNTQTLSVNNISKQNSYQQKQQHGLQQQNGQRNGNQKQLQNQKMKQQIGNQMQQNGKQNDGQLKAKKFVKNNPGNQNNGSSKITRLENDRRQYVKPKFNAGNGQRSMSLDGQSTLMYLGRLKIGTTDFEIRNYLHQKFPGYEFAVESLPLYKDAKLPSFKVKVDNRVLDEFQNLDNWPNSVKITKFNSNFRV